MGTAVSVFDALGADTLPARISVPAAVYRFEFEVTEPTVLPEFAGSAIRGAFGHALRKTACMMHQPDCKGCPLYRTCPYTAVFETPPPQDGVRFGMQTVPPAFVVEPPLGESRYYGKGDRLSFGLILFGRAAKQLPLVIFAMRRAFRHRIGSGRAELAAVYRTLIGDAADEFCVYLPGDSSVRPHSSQTDIDVPSGDTVRFDIITPLRIQNEGHPLGPTELSARAVLMAAVRRVDNIARYHWDRPLGTDFTALARRCGEASLKADLHWRDWTRHSGRQQRTMALGGVQGTIELANLTDEQRIFLVAGTITHIGKNAVFGLGKLRAAGLR